MKIPILIILIVVSILLTIFVLIQEIGSGLSPTFGGGGYSYHTRRGLEQKLFQATVILAVVFAVLSVYYLTLI